MARKREQRKYNVDSKSSNFKEKHQGVGNAPSVAKGAGNTSDVNELDRHNGISHPLNVDIKSVHSPVVCSKRNKISVKSPRKVGVEQHLTESEHTSQDSFEDLGSSFSRKSGTSDDHTSTSEHLDGHNGLDQNGLRTDCIARNAQLYNMLCFKNLKFYMLWVLKKSYEWAERREPFFVGVADFIRSSCDYFHRKYWHTYPILLRWLGFFKNMILLVSMVWLNCFVRGLDSFLHMGTTSFFSVIWCCMLSAIAMVGIVKFLMVVAVAAVIAIVFGFIFAILVVVMVGAVFLWLYGSFWTTSLVVVLGGVLFALSRERLSLLVTTTYSVYCAWTYVGWCGLLFGLNLSIFSSDALLYFLKQNMDEHRNMNSEQSAGMQGQKGFFKRVYSETDSAQPADQWTGVASSSGADSELSSEDEIIRLLNCTDHYSALGLSRYQEVDVSLLKKEYRKKAMLVHPDKNMGNEKAAEAFKKLQNAYEVLIDTLKQKAYDEELRKEELLNYICQFRTISQKKARHGFFTDEFARSETKGDDPREAKHIACKKCGGFHVWIQAKKAKAGARWCQDCKDYHQAKDGDGWVEQSSQPLLYGLLQKVEAPVAFVCADSKVYNATEWYICQGMRCPANSHKPSFHVNTSMTRHYQHGRGNPSQRGEIPPTSNIEDNMTEEEFFEWLQTAVNSGMFDNFAGGNSEDTTASSSTWARKNGPNGGGSGNVSGKKKKRGKKQW